MLSEIILPIFNPQKYIIEQMQSIYSQTHQCYNLTISDDLSTNNIQDLLKLTKTEKFKLNLFRQNTRLGIINNINFLLKKSQHNYLFFCDQDDVWLPHKIEISLKKMQYMEAEYGKTTPILIHSDLIVVDQKLNLIHPSFRQYQNLDPNPPKLLPRLLLQNFVTGCTMLINKPLKDLVTPIPSEAIMHDWWIALTAAALGKIAYIPEPTVLYRQHQQNSIGARKWNLSYILSRLNNIEKIRSDIQKTIIQAQKFRQTFQEQLSTEQLDVIDTYINLPNQPWLTRKYLMIKKGHYQLGKLKNLGFFCCT
ncbi:glycosyltransferase family 2 protein [Synechocystis salina LEGE 00031]|uniref:Glycosyltransferase family 2 protein n=1 Tax=Synechocystis salina LEGE 00031 TaxID=1828736 RepID=A0ABR9VWC6_9SYNC|nr:glycosyltransferase family 2 protein [Synechocystis salina]MBE9255675.1 glycosyltransferase family 2 protein [Synechocystis salina LEGE 00031]